MSEIIDGNVRQERGSLVWFEPVEPLGGIGHLVMTTRLGGISQAPYDSLNLGFHVGDVPERVRLNRVSLRRSLERRLHEPVVGDQVHGTAARTVGELHAGTRWEQNEKSLDQTDALITATRYLPLVIMVADCLPIALVDPVRGVAAAVHAGWRGLAGGILASVLGGMRETWGCVPDDLVAWIGPGIGPCCYEVGPEVAARFLHATRQEVGGGTFLDLRADACRRLIGAGLLEENITGLDLCTCCRTDFFFSHRRTTRDGGRTTGRQAMLLWLERNVELPS